MLLKRLGVSSRVLVIGKLIFIGDGMELIIGFVI